MYCCSGQSCMHCGVPESQWEACKQISSKISKCWKYFKGSKDQGAYKGCTLLRDSLEMVFVHIDRSPKFTHSGHLSHVLAHVDLSLTSTCFPTSHMQATGKAPDTWPRTIINVVFEIKKAQSCDLRVECLQPEVFTFGTFFCPWHPRMARAACHGFGFERPRLARAATSTSQPQLRRRPCLPCSFLFEAGRCKNDGITGRQEPFKSQKL